MNSTNRVSIIVLCHKQAEFLAGALGSAIAQTHKDTEIIVACGDAKSVHEASRWFTAFGQIKVLTGLEHGRSHAMNVAVSQSTGNYILRLDADDVLVPDCIEQMLTVLPAAIVGCDFQEFGSSRRRWSRTWDKLTLAMEKESNGLPCTSLVSRRMFDLVGGYDRALFGHEDWAFWIKCLKADAFVKRVTEPLFFYRRHTGQSLMMSYDEVLTSMIRLLHPDIYLSYEKDKVVVQRSSDEVKGWIALRATWFPDDRASRMFAGLIGSKV